MPLVVASITAALNASNASAPHGSKATPASRPPPTPNVQVKRRESATMKETKEKDKTALAAAATNTLKGRAANRVWTKKTNSLFEA